MTGVGVGAVRASIESLASLLMPADPNRRGVVVAADERWRFDPDAIPVGTDVVVWGRPPLPGGPRPAVAILSAAARERALLALRRRHAGAFRLVAVHPLLPGVQGKARVSNRFRRRLRAGALVVLATAHSRRVLDVVAEEAGVLFPVQKFHAGSGGAALCRQQLADGTPVLLRAAPAESPGDPSRGGEALTRLRSAVVACVPLLVGQGRVHGASWTLETLLPGRRPRTLTSRLRDDAARFCAALPTTAGPPTAPRADLDHIAALVPDRGSALRHVAAKMSDAANTMPAVMRHGDFWLGNLLAERGRLLGVVDWDAARSAAVPGSDLLQLVATDLRFRARRSLGEEWLAQPWRSTEFQAATVGYWRAIGWQPDEKGAEAISVAWWAAEVAGTLSRLPLRAADPRWLAANVDPVLARLSS